MDTKLIVSGSPHVRSDETTPQPDGQRDRGPVPGGGGLGGHFWPAGAAGHRLLGGGVRGAGVAVLQAAQAANPIGDLSAVVTGIILAMNVPVGMPLGQLAVGCVAAILITKQLFGGIGMNFATPPWWAASCCSSALPLR